LSTVEIDALATVPTQTDSSARTRSSAEEPPADGISNAEAFRTEPSQDERSQSRAPPLFGAITGTLVGFKENGSIPLVLFAGQCTSGAVAAATIVDLQGAYVGRQITLMLENGDRRRPVILGLLRDRQAWPLLEQPGQVEIDADGERLVVTAKEQLVLRCGDASITLTKEGKVLIQGTYVSNRSSGVMSIKGGSIKLN